MTIFLISAEIFVVEDDPLLQKALIRALSGAGYTVYAHLDAESMLDQLADKLMVSRNVCILMDVNLGSVSGIDAQKRVRQIDATLPVVFMSAQQDAHNVNQAWRDGASNFLFKPFTPKELLDAVRDAMDTHRRSLPALIPGDGLVASALQQQAARLTRRQRQVLELLVTGMTHQEIAHRIGISARTVKLHRAAMMQRLNCKNLPDLVRFHELCKQLLS